MAVKRYRMKRSNTDGAPGRKYHKKMHLMIKIRLNPSTRARQGD
eukprot:CAMPEP_0115555172 /NCGR_PEP_ID=MMETSP0271-20121206/97685_1 /TAXON_ID=71861 /ORGANISM="Scrippsiella trochoidea, Strain CCMP3099" /LENGTH=43 /DNA_ID= /DNA_START= /DNA_END= /DNA_ORIENTATION=